MEPFFIFSAFFDVWKAGHRYEDEQMEETGGAGSWAGQPWGNWWWGAVRLWVLIVEGEGLAPHPDCWPWRWWLLPSFTPLAQAYSSSTANSPYAVILYPTYEWATLWGMHIASVTPLRFVTSADLIIWLYSIFSTGFCLCLCMRWNCSGDE